MKEKGARSRRKTTKVAFCNPPLVKPCCGPWTGIQVESERGGEGGGERGEGGKLEKTAYRMANTREEI